jgi:hypothetical protein
MVLAVCRRGLLDGCVGSDQGYDGPDWPVAIGRIEMIAGIDRLLACRRRRPRHYDDRGVIDIQFKNVFRIPAFRRLKLASFGKMPGRFQWLSDSPNPRPDRFGLSRERRSQLV